MNILYHMEQLLRSRVYLHPWGHVLFEERQLGRRAVRQFKAELELRRGLKAVYAPCFILAVTNQYLLARLHCPLGTAGKIGSAFPAHGKEFVDAVCQGQ
jgi:hypothetical protein